MRELKFWWYLWTYRLVRFIAPKLGKPYAWAGGRRTDGFPVVCEQCGHVCRLKDAHHAYQDDGAGDVEAVDECPRCGSSQLADSL